MDMLLHYLREHRLEEVDGKCPRENVGMAALAKKQGFEVGAEPTGDTIAMHLDLRE